MKDHFKYYSTPEELSAFNFYKADEDIRYLLHDRHVQINDLVAFRLSEVLLELREWFSVQYNKASHVGQLNKQSKKLHLESMLIALNSTMSPYEKIELIEGHEIKKISWIVKEDTLIELKNRCKDLRIPFIDNRIDFINSVKRYIKGVTNDYNRLVDTIDKRQVDFNYVRECLVVSKVLKMPIDPMKISLREWLEYLKLAEDAE